MDPVERLSKYGEVKTCKKVHDNVATILVTEGFDNSAVNTFGFLRDCQECFPSVAKLETFITDKNFAFVVLVAN